MGRGGGQVVSVLVIYSDNPNSNPANAYNFSVKLVFEKNKNKQKRGRGWPILKKERYCFPTSNLRGSNQAIWKVNYPLGGFECKILDYFWRF